MRSLIHKFRLLSGFILLVGAIIIFFWVYYPTSSVEQVFKLPELEIPSSFVDEDLQVYDGEIEVILRSPSKLHVGEKSLIELDLNAFPANEMTPVSLPDQVHLLAEARIDLPLMSIQPEGNISQPFSMTHPLYYRWEIESYQAGQVQGQLWFYLTVVSETGETDRNAMLAVPFEFEQSALLGFSEKLLRWVGAGVFLAALLVFPLFKSHK